MAKQHDITNNQVSHLSLTFNRIIQNAMKIQISPCGIIIWSIFLEKRPNRWQELKGITTHLKWTIFSYVKVVFSKKIFINSTPSSPVL